MQILITGCNGTLGSFLYDNMNHIDHTIIPSTRDMCDLSIYENIELVYGHINPHTIVHCAAYTDVKKSNEDQIKVFNDNILASVNLLKYAMTKNSKFVFISTDFVFDGKKGFYTTDDLINPQSIYAKSKASIELALACYPNSLVIRTSFFQKSFPFNTACTDRFTSKDYIDIIGPLIIEEIMGSKTGILHVGTERKTFYELAMRRKSVKPCMCLDDSDIGRDYSFLL